MSIRFEYLCYRRKFLRPLATAHGEWHWREGMVIRLEDVDGSVGFGEIAPVPWFGTETVEQALQWCKEVPPEITGALQVPTELPCCGFALSAALEHRSRSASRRTFPVAGLITSSSSLEEKQADGFSTFKVKIGLHSIEEETRQIEALVEKLTPGQRLRLDANGGLSESAYSAWLEFLEGQPVEFLEQPLSPGLENRMLEMAEPFSIPLALDESVAG
ncbi:MAG: o-succinylbenzoate synthase, partial [Verrucomicrobia bacterium]|nr:o-succinylbenzoate synthase [Verrucomicrobiota bacterium]